MKSIFMSAQGESDFPVIKISLDFTILDCNVSALPLLNFWSCKVNSRIPETVMNQYPEIANSLKQNDEGGLNVKFKGFNIRFTIVPFPEAGYIGLYGYQVEKADIPVKIFNQIN
jgi:hypothetical protein